MWKCEFDQNDLTRWFRAVANIKRAVPEIADAMCKDCAIQYADDVVQAISRMGRPSPAYSKRYRVWKSEYGRMGYPSPWRLGGDLQNSITAYPSRMGARNRTLKWTKAWVGGVPEGVMDSGGKSWFGTGSSGKSKKIAMYGTVGEYGGLWPRAGLHPERPVFGPARDEFWSGGKMFEYGDIAQSKILALWG